MRWKSDIKAECCAGSEDESGSLLSNDEVGHASRFFPPHTRGAGALGACADGRLVDICLAKPIKVGSSLSLRAGRPHAGSDVLSQFFREMTKKISAPRVPAIKTQVVNETSSPFLETPAQTFVENQAFFFNCCY